MGGFYPINAKFDGEGARISGILLTFAGGYVEVVPDHHTGDAAAGGCGSGGAHHCRAGARGDGLADVRAHGEGREGDARGRQHPVYGDEQRVCVSEADVQEQAAGAVVYEARDQREEGAAHRQGGAADADRDHGTAGDAARREGQGGAYQARGGGYLPHVQAEDEETDVLAGQAAHQAHRQGVPLVELRHDQGVYGPDTRGVLAGVCLGIRCLAEKGVRPAGSR